ncbi:DUF29 family protein [Nostoc sp.]|uniref:DUF29 family protein n=1 Tax=Nostoc sp. TaxID=1180 RepID=UPI002FF85F76
MSATYKADFNLWIEQTAQLLRSHRWQSLQYLLQQSPFEFPRFATDISLDKRLQLH